MSEVFERLADRGAGGPLIFHFNNDEPTGPVQSQQVDYAADWTLPADYQDTLAIPKHVIREKWVLHEPSLEFAFGPP